MNSTPTAAILLPPEKSEPLCFPKMNKLNVLGVFEGESGYSIHAREPSKALSKFFDIGLEGRIPQEQPFLDWASKKYYDQNTLKESCGGAAILILGIVVDLTGLPVIVQSIQSNGIMGTISDGRSRALLHSSDFGRTNAPASGNCGRQLQYWARLYF